MKSNFVFFGIIYDMLQKKLLPVQKLHVVLFLISLIFISNMVSAEPLLTSPSIKLLSEYYTNSSDFTRRGIGAEFGASSEGGIHFDAGYVLSDFSQHGFEDIVRHSVFIQGQKQVSEKIGIVLRLSENFYDNENENFNGGVFLRYQPLSNVFTEFSFRHYDLIDLVLPFNNVIYSHVVTIGALDRDIKSNDYKVYILFTPVQRVSIAGEFIYGDYSDNNRKHSFMLETGYQLLEIPYLRTAYNYYFLDIKDSAPLTRNGKENEAAYWDPVNFETHTVRLEYKQDLNEKLLIGAEAALSYSPKSGELSKSAFAFASYRLTGQSSLRFDARWFDQNSGIDRLGETDSFRATNYNITFQHLF